MDIKRVEDGSPEWASVCFDKSRSHAFCAIQGIKINLVARWQILPGREDGQKQDEKEDVGDFEHVEEPFMPVHRSAIRQVEGAVHHLEPLNDAEDTTHQHHETRHVQNTSDYPKIAREQFRLPAAPLHQGDETEEAQLKNSLDDQRSQHPRQARTPLTHGFSRSVSRRAINSEDFNDRVKDDERAKNPARVDGHVVRNVGQHAAEDEVLSASEQRRA